MTNLKPTLKIFLITTVIVIIASYAYYKTKDFLSGPIITVSSPENGATMYDSFVEIAGVAKNVSYLSIDDRQIFTNEEGDFMEKLLLFRGYNIISIKASDKFDRKIEETLEIIYKAPIVEINLRERSDLEEQVSELLNNTN